MAITEFIIKKNDLQPYYYAKAQKYDSNNNRVVLDLTGASIVCTMKSPQGTIEINRKSCVITDSTAGLFEYRWAAGDTTAVGKYYIEFEVTPQTGGKFTLPPNNGAIVRIKSDLDNT